jgi:galactose mutarotase-like enzyme
VSSHPWHQKISHRAQVGGIETSVLDNGAGRGTRIAWINTGTGLRYKIMIDRAMDIADAFYGQHSLAWLSHLGVTPPQPFSSHGMDWLRNFGGGLLVTCGLSHSGPPDADEYGERGLHGLISNTPAEIESIVQPDPIHGNLEMSITGRIRETRIFGPSLELRRTISGTLGKAMITIHDEVVNLANTPAPHMMLYHFNFGWPLVDEGTEHLWKGSWRSPNGDPKNKLFREDHNFRICQPPLDQHSGTGEDVAFIDATPDKEGNCTAGLYNQKLGMALAIRFRKSQLPVLNNWQHWGKGEYVTGLEPGTNPPIGQAQARREKTLIILGPGERRSYDVQIEVFENQKNISDLIEQTRP